MSFLWYVVHVLHLIYPCSVKRSHHWDHTKYLKISTLVQSGRKHRQMVGRHEVNVDKTFEKEYKYVKIV